MKESDLRHTYQPTLFNTLRGGQYPFGEHWGKGESGKLSQRKRQETRKRKIESEEGTKKI